MDRVKGGISRVREGALTGVRCCFAKFFFLSFILAAAYYPTPPALCAQNNGTEFGAVELTVLGTSTISDSDPEVEIKGFSVFGSTQASYTGVVHGPGNVVINGQLWVASGAYFSGNSTFTANMYMQGVSTFADVENIYIPGGGSNQVLAWDADGSLKWSAVSSLGSGDNLGNHIATTTLNMGGQSIVNIASATLNENLTVYSTVTVLVPETETSSLWVSTSILTPHLYVSTGGNVGIGTASPGSPFVTAPGSKLAIYGNRTSEVLLKMHTDGASYGWLFQSAGSDHGRVAMSAFNGTSRNIFLDPEPASASYIAAGDVGISTRVPQGRLDVMDDGKTATDMVQLWRDSDGNIKSSMSATGVMMATKFIGDGSGLINLDLAGAGDNLGNHVATTTLDMANYGIVNVASATITGNDGGGVAAGYGLNVSSNVSLAGVVYTRAGKAGIGVAAPLANFQVNGVGRFDGGSYTNASAQTVSDAAIVVNTGKYIYFDNSGGAGQLRRLIGINYDASGIVGDLSIGQGGTLLISSITLRAGNAGYISMIPGTGEAMRISSTGYVGIGNIDPVYKLDVTGGGHFTSSMTVDGELYSLGVSSFTGGVAMTKGQNVYLPNAANLYLGDGAANQVLAWDTDGSLKWSNVSSLGSGDNLGSHIATQTLDMANFGIVNSGSITASSMTVTGNTFSVGASTFSVFGGSVAIGAVAGASTPAGLYVVGTSSFAGSGHFGAAAATTPQLTVLGGASGGSMLTLSRSQSVPYKFSMGLAGYGLLFRDDNNGAAEVANMYGGNSLNQFYLGVKSHNSAANRPALLSAETLSSAAGSDQDAVSLTIQGGLGTGAGTAGNIYFDTGDSGASGTTPHVASTKMSILSGGNVGISTGVPQARLDVLAGGSAATDMAQIWRDSDGNIKSSMSATGVMMATKFIGDGSGLTNLNLTGAGDNLGSHVATKTLDMANFGITNAGSVTASSLTVTGNDGGTYGMTVSSNVSLAGALYTAGGKVLISTSAPTDPLSLLEVAGAVTVGTMSATTSQLTVYGGSGGGPMVTLYRSPTARFSWALAGNGLSVLDDVNASHVINLFGGGGTNQLYIGQQGKAAGSRDALLSAETLGTAAGSDVSASDFTIQGGLGTGAGIPGNIYFNTGIVGGSGSTPQSASTKMAILYGGNVGISTGAPEGRLDVLAGGTAATDMAQIWRAGDGVIKGSMSATGVMMATKFIGDGSALTNLNLTGSGDNLGSHVATKTLDMAGYDIVGISTITVSSITTTAAGVTISTNLYVMNGKVGIGTTPSDFIFEIASDDASSDAEADIRLITHSDNPGESDIIFVKTRSNGAIVSGDRLGSLYFEGHDGTDDTTQGARIQAYSEGTIATDRIPANIRFYTHPDSTDPIAERMRIDSAGNIGIGTTTPQGRLDVKAVGPAPTDMAQIWRAGDGVIKGSMSATGVMMATRFIGDGSGLTNLNLTGAGDNLGNHIATTTLNMGTNNLKANYITGSSVTLSDQLVVYGTMTLVGSSTTVAGSTYTLMDISATDSGPGKVNAVQMTLTDSLPTDSALPEKFSLLSYYNKTGVGNLSSYKSGGIYARARVSGGSQQHLMGVYSSVETAGGGTNLVTGYNFYAAGDNAGLGGTLNNRAGLWVDDIGRTTTQQQYGVYLAPMTSAVTNYGIYSSSGINYFGGVSTFTGTVSMNNNQDIYLSTPSRIHVTGGVADQVLANNGSNALKWTTLSSLAGDNLGNHIATTTLNMGGQSIVNIASATLNKNLTVYSTVTVLSPETTASSLWVSTSNITPHLYVSTGGNVGIGTASPGSPFLPPDAPVPGSKLAIYSDRTSEVLLNMRTDGESYGWLFQSAGATHRVAMSSFLGTSRNIYLDPSPGAASYIVAGNIGISTRVPQGRLDVMDDGKTATDMVQLWRDSDGTIVSSMSATGVMKAARFIGDGSGLSGISGDNLGNHIATTTLNMASSNIINVSSISYKANVYTTTATAAQQGGLYVSTNVYANGNMTVQPPGALPFQIMSNAAYAGIVINGIEIARIKP